MPRLDGRGPTGAGPGTGRGRGPCGAGDGRGFGGWFGRGRGMGWFGGLWSSQDKKTALDNEEKMLKSELDQIKKEKENLKS